METFGECAVCKEDASMRCTGCHNIFYCGKPHQQEHWPIHKAYCRCCKMKVDPELGPHLVATRNIEPMEHILQEAPLALGPHHRRVVIPPYDDICASCCRDFDPKMKIYCPRCKFPICSKSCPGLKDDGRHALECELLAAAKVAHQSCPQQVLLFVRTLLIREREPEKWALMLEMAEHAVNRQIDEDTGNNRVFNAVAETIKVLARKGRRLIPEFQKPFLAKINALLDVYTFELDPVLGDGDLLGLYGTASLLKQSCMPNTNVNFEPDVDWDGRERPNWRGRIYVRASRRIKKGEVLTICHASVLQCTRTRAEEFRLHKNMLCACSRCSDPSELGTFAGATKCGCGGWVLPVNTTIIEHCDWQCTSCKASMGPLAWLAVTEEMSNCAARVTENWVRGEKLTPVCQAAAHTVYAKLNRCLHPSHLLFVKFRHFWMQTYGLVDKPGERLDKLTDDEIDHMDALSKEILIAAELLGQYHNRSVIFAMEPLIHIGRAQAERAKRMLELGVITREQAAEQVVQVREKYKRAIELSRVDPFSPVLEKLRRAAETEELSLLAWSLKVALKINTGNYRADDKPKLSSWDEQIVKPREEQTPESSGDEPVAGSSKMP